MPLLPEAVRPGGAAALVVPIETARSARRPRSRPADPATRVVLVASGREGTGASTVAALLALAASATHERVLLVDADSRAPAMQRLLGAGFPATPGAGQPAHEEGDEDAVVVVTESLSLLRRLPPATPAGAGADEPRGSLAALAAAFDLVVVDAGSRAETIRAVCAAGVSQALVVGRADRISIAANYALVKVLASRLAVPSVGLLVNQSDEGTAEQVHAEILGAARYFLHAEVAFCGSVPDDPCLRAGLQAGMSLIDAVAGSPAAAAVQQIGKTLVPQLTPAAAVADRRSHWRS